ncbi:MAG: hypothetical protein ACLGHP_10700 [Vicinamibacteria bacterium]
MLRHFQLFAPAPGREAEAERALLRWLDGVATAAEFRGGAVLREYAGEFGDVQGALAVMYDVESRESGAALRQATASVPNPMAQDVPGDEPADQGAVLFNGSAAHGHDNGHDHVHGDDDHAHGAGLPGLRYDRGGGMLARLFHGHFTVVEGRAAASSASTTREVAT